MYRNHPQNTTSIDELPDIDELEGPTPFQPAIRNHLRDSKYPGSSMIPVTEADKVKKYIRNGHNPLDESGMNNMYIDPPQTPMSTNVNNMYNDDETLQNYHQQYSNQNPNLKRFNMPASSPSCIEFCEHVINCPVCSRLYNNDKTIYIIAIVILSFICILLLKKVLDV